MKIEALPKQKLIMETINHYLIQGNLHDMVGKKRLQKEIENLKQINDFSRYYQSLGLMAIFDFDENKIVHLFEKALQIDSFNTTEIIFNYLASLHRIGSYKKYNNLLKIYYNKLYCFDLFQNIGQFHHTQNIWNVLSDEVKNRFNVSEEKLSMLQQCIELIDYETITDNDILERLNLLGSILKSHQIMIQGTMFHLLNDGIRFNLYVTNLSYDKKNQLELEYYNMLDEYLESSAQGFENPIEHIISFQLVRVEK